MTITEIGAVSVTFRVNRATNGPVVGFAVRDLPAAVPELRSADIELLGIFVTRASVLSLTDSRLSAIRLISFCINLYELVVFGFGQDRGRLEEHGRARWQQG